MWLYGESILIADSLYYNFLQSESSNLDISAAMSQGSRHDNPSELVQTITVVTSLFWRIKP
jgi:hypothetical protein